MLLAWAQSDLRKALLGNERLINLEVTVKGLVGLLVADAPVKTVGVRAFPVGAEHNLVATGFSRYLRGVVHQFPTDTPAT